MNLRPYFKMADDEAKKSPCVRRQYGCVIIWTSEEWAFHVVGANYRMSGCCDGECARNRADTAHGARVEVGAEVHAETAALIKFPYDEYIGKPIMVLVGWIGDKRLKGSDVYCCHTCALNVKFAGVEYVYIIDDDDTVLKVPIEDMIARREQEWVG